MSKRTVTRWIGQEVLRMLTRGNEFRSVAPSKSDPFGHLFTEIAISWNDVQPEEARCPCVGNVCCRVLQRGLSVSGKLKECCTCHTGGQQPCLSDFHKPAQANYRCLHGYADPTCPICQQKPQPPATKERVVEGTVLATFGKVEPSSFSEIRNARREGEGIPATLIIHEPVNEPTLYEIFARYMKENPGAADAWSTDGLWQEVIAAFNREKAARERGKT